jgi:hypothetical protein
VLVSYLEQKKKPRFIRNEASFVFVCLPLGLAGGDGNDDASGYAEDRSADEQSASTCQESATGCPATDRTTGAAWKGQMRTVEVMRPTVTS